MNWNDLFTYDAATGNLIWRPREGAPKMVGNFNKSYAGTVAGARAYTPTQKPRGIVCRHRDGDKVSDTYAHRIVWEMHNGPIPKGLLIDHINGNAFDNRLENLRLATHAQNLQNMALRPSSRSGLKGVRYDAARGLWTSEVRANGVRYRLGYFQTKGLAAVARAKAALRYHGEFVRFA